MLSFATEFPIENIKNFEFLQEIVKTWIVESPHTSLKNEDMEFINFKEEDEVSGENQRIISLLLNYNKVKYFAIKNLQESCGVLWDTQVVFSRDDDSTWVGIRVSNESRSVSAELPSAKKPIIVRSILEKFGGGQDGEMIVNDRPYFISEGEIDLAAKIINGYSDCYLPIVYISRQIFGKSIIDPIKMAKKLSGMAHVIVEPSYYFSSRLKIETNAKNIRGGNLGIYWPDGIGRDVVLLDKNTNDNNIRNLIFEKIRRLLLNRRPKSVCTWGSAEEALSKKNIDKLKHAGSQELDWYVAEFNKEKEAIERKLARAEVEITNLKGKLRASENTSIGDTLSSIKIGSEQNFFDYEIEGVVLDALVAAKQNMPDERTRRYHILEAIINENKNLSRSNELKQKIKDIMKSNKNFDSKIKKELEGIGFSIEDDRKHIRITFMDDNRYAYSLAKTGSDHRGGMNAASDLSKLIF